ncbi:hypothetical protein KAW08_02880 [bacterium]|nr:hypothetical protein [bacterium]
MKNVLIVLDIGTSSIKCGSIDRGLNIIESMLCDFKINHKGNIYESDFEECFKSAREILKKIVKITIQKDYFIEAILITSQAQTFMPVDKDFNSLDKGIVWLDTRAVEEEAYLSEKLPEFYKTAGFSKPLSSLYISKLLWLKKNKAAIYKKAAYFPLINEYVAFRLTKKFYSDYTGFGMGGVFDIRKKRLNQKALDILELTQDNFPEIKEAAGISYKLTHKMRNEFGLKKELPVYFCGNDQSASAVGAGLEAEGGDISANFGTAMVLYTIIKKPLNSIKENQIIGINPLTNDYFLISLDSQFGNIIHKFKTRYFQDISYDDFFSRFNTVKNKDAFIEIKAINNEFIYDKSADKDIIASSVIKYFLNRFLSHLSEIEKISHPNQIYVSGGVSQFKVWLDILAKNCKYKIIPSFGRDAGIIGAAKIYRNKKKG